MFKLKITSKRLFISFILGYKFYQKKATLNEFIKYFETFKNEITKKNLSEEELKILEKSLKFRPNNSLDFVNHVNNIYSKNNLLFKFWGIIGNICLLIGISGYIIDNPIFASITKYIGCIYVICKLFIIIRTLFSHVSSFFFLFRSAMYDFWNLFNNYFEIFFFFLGYTFYFALEILSSLLSLIFQVFILIYYLQKIEFLNSDKFKVDINDILKPKEKSSIAKVEEYFFYCAFFSIFSYPFIKMIIFWWIG